MAILLGKQVLDFLDMTSQKLSKSEVGIISRSKSRGANVSSDFGFCAVSVFEHFVCISFELKRGESQVEGDSRVTFKKDPKSTFKGKLKVTFDDTVSQVVLRGPFNTELVNVNFWITENKLTLACTFVL
ncbi:hypothetical protein BGZ72_010903 [Mortierella alpina]|nr:hypothetical protein BGZ72_010903 [Mortierella alpina]